VRAAAASLSASLEGARWPVRAEPLVAATSDAADLAREARDAFVARGAREVTDPLYVSGASRLAGTETFTPPNSAASLLELLEHQVEMVSLVRDLLDEDGTSVSIGSENPIDELRDCSIVVAPYTVDGEVAGTVGVLGPTRMDYRQALAAVEAISEELGRVLS
jgi:heat-inducible transcriptional repressor